MTVEAAKLGTKMPTLRGHLSFLVVFLAVTAGLAPTNAASLGADDRVTVLVHLETGHAMDAGVEAARERGITVGSTYPEIGVFVAHGASHAVRGLAVENAIAYIEPDAPLRYQTDTSHVATRGSSVLSGEVRLPDGTKIDGKGAGVAIIDAGIDGSHPDLADRMVENLRVVCPGPCFFVPLEDTDHAVLAGHGTHMAGIVAGGGEASNGVFHGAAPGAGLYGLGAGAVIWITEAVAALGWVLENHDEVDPPIFVVNNSWAGGNTKPDPDAPDAITKMQMELLDSGVTVVFAASNRGGDGSEQQTSTECVLTQPGNICVANYYDRDTGTRDDGWLTASSSRGDRADPETWPDLSAPGGRITSTCRWTLPVCWLNGEQETDPPNMYATLSGTSMAAPHVAGIAALLYQVDPSLLPPEVEWVLKETAYKFSLPETYTQDPLHAGGTSSFDKGHGLVDARAAVEAVLQPLVVSSPNPDSSASGGVELEGRIWYGDTVEIAVDGQPVARLPEVVRFWSYTLTGLEQGSHSITMTLSSVDRVVSKVERIVWVS